MIVNIQEIDLQECQAPADDMRKSSKELQVWLGASRNAFGLLRLPVYNAQTKNVIDGRLLVRHLRSVGLGAIPMIVIDVPLEQENLIRLALNNHAGDWQWEVVSGLLKKVDPKMSGFHSMEYNPLLAADWKQAKVDENGGQFSLEL